MISMYACPIISPTSSPTITPSTTPTQTQTQTFTPSPNPTSNPSNIIYNSFKFFGNLCPTSGYNVTVGNYKTCSNAFENIKLECFNSTGFMIDQFEVYCQTLVPTTPPNPSSATTFSILNSILFIFSLFFYFF